MNLWILLPCLNEFDNVKKLVQDVDKTKFKKYNIKILIVDDGSTDEIGKYYKNFLINKKIKIFYVKHKINRGLAATLNTGFNFIFKKSNNDKDIIITMDADASHSIKYITLMIYKIQAGFDIVIASRFIKKSKVVGLSFFRIILSYAASYIYRCAFRFKIKEFTCNFRAYKFSFIKNFFLKNNKFISETGFTCIPDILLKIIKEKKNVKITEVPFILRYDLKKGPSKINIFSTIIKTISLIYKRKFL
jgi:dolichol-phosphate mannosyltransferase